MESLFDATEPQLTWECDSVQCSEEFYGDETEATNAGWIELGESYGRHFGTCPTCQLPFNEDE